MSMHGRRRNWCFKTAIVACGAIAGVAALAGTANAAAAPNVTRPKPGASLITNGNFEQPGAATHEGAAPTGWKLVDLGAEKKPFDASIGAWNAKGKFPPPKGNPNKSDVAVEAFYEAGSATGLEGIGGQQAVKAGAISQANNPQITFADVANSAPEASVAAWAGSGIEIVFTSGKHTGTLIYLNPWTAFKSTFKGKPADTASVKYVLGPTLKADSWYTWKARSINADILKQFKLRSYTITDVRFVDWEDTTSAAKPFPNMDGYFANLAITEGPAAKKH
jgi:hypothetical protein